MDQVKVGKFIAECRKKQGMTQNQLAEKLSITDRAVSKWETGKAMPDSSIMLELCDALEITVNDLLNGERVSVENYNKKMERQLLEVIAEKEISDKWVLRLITILCVLAPILEILLFQVPYWYSPDKATWVDPVCMVLALSTIAFPILASRLESKIGYFSCKHCGHVYKPKFWTLFWAWGTVKKRYLRCPECDKKSWQHRVYTKDIE